MSKYLLLSLCCFLFCLFFLKLMLIVGTGGFTLSFLVGVLSNDELRQSLSKVWALFFLSILKIQKRDFYSRTKEIKFSLPWDLFMSKYFLAYCWWFSSRVGNKKNHILAFLGVFISLVPLETKSLMFLFFKINKVFLQRLIITIKYKGFYGTYFLNWIEFLD